MSLRAPGSVSSTLRITRRVVRDRPQGRSSNGSTMSLDSRSPQLYIVNVSVPAEVERALDAPGEHERDRRHGRLSGLSTRQRDARSRCEPSRRSCGCGRGPRDGPRHDELDGRNVAWVRRGWPSVESRAYRPARPSLGRLAYRRGGESVGPFAPVQMAQAVAAGRVTGATLVWSPGMDAWTAASDVEALAGYFAPQPPPIPGSGS